MFRKLSASAVAVTMLFLGSTSPAMAADPLWEKEPYPYAAIDYQQLQAQKALIESWEKYQETIAATQEGQVEGATEPLAADPIVVSDATVTSDAAIEPAVTEEPVVADPVPVVISEEVVENLEDPEVATPSDAVIVEPAVTEEPVVDEIGVGTDKDGLVPVLLAGGIDYTFDSTNLSGLTLTLQVPGRVGDRVTGFEVEELPDTGEIGIPVRYRISHVIVAGGNQVEYAGTMRFSLERVIAGPIGTQSYTVRARVDTELCLLSNPIIHLESDMGVERANVTKTFLTGHTRLQTVGGILE